jgi:uncharacterized hydrophobic protein (TIGR00271 family)
LSPDERDFLSRKIRQAQNKIAKKMGSGRREREKIVVAMLKRHKSDTVSYWLQIVMSLGIATLGLVLDSTAVVIGAMLISPLMEPIVGLGMGLAVGSPFLTLRSATRVLNSIIGVILIAAFLTMLLPFQEVTSEIAARTSPTALDLAVATFCALAAAFTTVKQSSDTAAAAAGTAIGIALVPPLCVAGFGLGTLMSNVFFGALLLFIANLVAILLFSVLVFYVTGFNQVEVSRLEAAEVKSQGIIAVIARRISAAFGAKYGSLLRVAMPVVLLASVYVPLKAAMEKVAWEVEVRRDVGALLKEVAPPGKNFVRTQMTVGDGTVGVSMVMLGTPEQARTLEHALERKVAALSGVEPNIEVLAVPDHASLAAMAQTAVKADPVVETIHGPDLSEVYQTITNILEQRWPEDAGTMLRWDLEFDAEGKPEVRVIHTGETLGPLGRSLLGDLIGSALNVEVEVLDSWVELGTWDAPQDDVAPWLPRLLGSLDKAREYDRLYACVSMGPVEVERAADPPEADTDSEPRGKPGKRRKGQRGASSEPGPPATILEPLPGARAALEVVAAAGRENVRAEPTGRWSVTLRLDPCPEPAPNPVIPPTPVRVGDESAATEGQNPLRDAAAETKPAGEDDPPRPTGPGPSAPSPDTTPGPSDPTTPTDPRADDAQSSTAGDGLEP